MDRLNRIVFKCFLFFQLLPVGHVCRILLSGACYDLITYQGDLRQFILVHTVSPNHMKTTIFIYNSVFYTLSHKRLRCEREMCGRGVLKKLSWDKPESFISTNKSFKKGSATQTYVSC